MNKNEQNNQKNEVVKDFYTVKEASKMIGITEFTLRKYCRLEKIKSFKKFGKWFIFMSDIKDFLKSE